MRFAISVCALSVITLLVLSVLVTSSGAVPNCSQVGKSFCEPEPGCTVQVEFQGSCHDSTRQWQCVWDCSGVRHEGGFEPCNCEGPGCDCLLPGTAVWMADGTVRMLPKES